MNQVLPFVNEMTLPLCFAAAGVCGAMGQRHLSASSASGVGYRPAIAAVKCMRRAVSFNRAFPDRTLRARNNTTTMGRPVQCRLLGVVRRLHLSVFFLGTLLACIFLGTGQGTAFFQRGRVGFADIFRFVGLVRCHAGRLVVRRGLRVGLSGFFCFNVACGSVRGWFCVRFV